MYSLLFLDVDGVLNGHEPLDPEVMCGRLQADKVRLLNRVLRRTEARIVVSSAWRYLVHRGDMNLSGMDWLLRSNGGMAGRIIGITRLDTMTADGRPAENERGEQISDWLMEHRFQGRYAVVDDLDLGITAADHPFVRTNGTVGLTEADAEELIELLGGQTRPESCCECGNDYPRSRLLRGHIYCSACEA